MKKMMVIAAALTCISATVTLTNAALASSERKAAQLRANAPAKTVLQFDEAVVRKVLTEDGYDELFIINQLLTLRQRDGRLQPLFNAYLKDRSLSEAFAANGTTIKMVMSSQDKDFWNGLEYMEICIDNPDIAEHIRKTALMLEEGRKH